jgi:uncharacterized membrane protein YeiH
VLTSGLYAIPALAGACIAVLVDAGTTATAPAAAFGAGACFLIRMLGVRYDLHAPARGPSDDVRG